MWTLQTPPKVPILQGIYPDRPKDSEIHSDSTKRKIKIRKGEEKNLLHNTRNPPEKEREINKEADVHTNPQQE